ncbi:MAG: Gfo/Idh/MocA family protein [Steroidobacteraceae bacterium]
MKERPIRLGIAGLGRAFSLMLPTFLEDARIELAAACDPREEARTQFALEFGVPVYSSIDGLVDDPRVDAVYVASPHQCHAEHARVAAAHGKHLLVEKPMALTMAECDAMIDASRAAKVQLIVGHCHSFDTPHLRAREIIESGAVGPVRMIQASNYTDFLYRPRRAEELNTEAGGGVVFSQAAHQIDIVRLLAGSRATRVRAVTGSWDPARPTEGAYCALLWFEDGVFASLNYNGYAHFDSDEWCGWIGEMGERKNSDTYGLARRRLSEVRSSAEEARLKAAGTYGGVAYKPPGRPGPEARRGHQHFGPIIVSCERGDVRPTPEAIWVYGNEQRERRLLPPPAVPRSEVIDELYGAIVSGESPIHDGRWAKSTLEVCLALLESAREQRDVVLAQQVGLQDRKRRSRMCR